MKTVSTSSLATSAGGRTNSTPLWAPVILVFGAMSAPGTALASPLSPRRERALLAQLQTHALDPLPPQESVQSTSSALAELRRLSGLTWQQLAGVLGVARRSLHFWASGKPINAANEEHLRRSLQALRLMDRGSAHANREVLLAEQGGVLPIDLLTQGRFDELLKLVGPGTVRNRCSLAPLSQGARDARKPISPIEQLEALHDRPVAAPGRGRGARTLRNTRRKRD